jgi:hypothetical protein
VTFLFAVQLTSSTRYGDSRAAYREVQERHQDIRRIEQTLGELAQLFNDVGATTAYLMDPRVLTVLFQMATLLGEQEEKIDAIETQAAEVAHDTEGGYAAPIIITYTRSLISFQVKAHRSRSEARPLCPKKTLVLLFPYCGHHSRSCWYRSGCLLRQP